MKAIFEMVDGSPYLYVESEKHFKKLEFSRTSPLVTIKDLNNQCDLTHYGDNFHVVLNLKDVK